MEKHNTPWGWWQVLAEGDDWKVKLLHVNAGYRTSLQFHKKRSEEWLCVKGLGATVLYNSSGYWSSYSSNDKFQPGDGAHVGKEIKHRLEGRAPDGVTILEYQSGNCREKDVIRIEDDHGRA